MTKAIVSVILYILSFFSMGITGDVYVSVGRGDLDAVYDNSSSFIYTCENHTNKPIYNQAVIIKLEKRVGNDFIDVTSSIDTSVKEIAYTIYPHSDDTNRCEILKPLEPGYYRLWVRYETAESFGNAKRVTKTIYGDFDVWDHTSSYWPG